MVTDITNSYTSPAGKEFTLTAGRFSGISPASNVLDLGCGYGEGICNLATEFRCKAKAIDINAENIEDARELSISRKVSHLIDFQTQDILESDFSEEPADLILAEGGVFSFIGREKGLQLASSWLDSRGWLAFSDIVLLSENIPNEILEIFENKTYNYETEASYRRLLKDNGYSTKFMCLVPPSGWDNYYAHMARRLEDDKGFFASRQIKLAFHREIDVFYRLEATKYVGYLVGIVRKEE